MLALMAIGALRYGALTDVGRKREHNEDNFLVDRSLNLFIVCDGMGGHAAGEVASALAVRRLHEKIRAEADLLQDYVDGKTGASKVTQKEIINLLTFAANDASKTIHDEAQREESKRGMGTTLILMLFLGTQAFVMHVGDSRAYMLRNHRLEQLTDDHNVYNELIKRKKMNREQVEKLAPKNAITRAVGVYEHCEPEVVVLDVAAGDRFLLCSDGLTEYFDAPEGTMEELGLYLAKDDSEQEISRQLVQHANDAGGKDNITAVIVTLGEPGEKDAARLERLQLKREILAKMPLFRTLAETELRRIIQVTEVVTYSDGQNLINEGERGEELYIVLEGTVDVIRNGSTVTSLKAGEHFGEMALIRSQPRSATIRSNGESVALIIRRLDFFEILRTEHQIAVKLLWQFNGVLADRLASTTKDLGVARAELAVDLSNDAIDELWDDDDDRKTIELPTPPVSKRPQPIKS